MSEKIDRTLKKLVENTLNGIGENRPDENKADLKSDRAGLPDCPECGGLGYLRQDYPLGHPDFGQVTVCSCRRQQIGEKVRQRLFILSNLDELRHLNFENFQPRGRVGLWPQEANSLEMAYNQAHHYAQQLNGWLYLQGNYGCGKTHLAAAIANFAVDLGVPTLFITVPDLLDALRFAFADGDTGYEDRFEDIRQVSLLVLDDFGTQNATPWAQEKLFQIINYRYINHLPLVVTTNMRLSDIEGRIRSRLEDPELVTKVRIDAADYRRPSGDADSAEVLPIRQMRCTFANFDMRKKDGLPAQELKSLEAAFRTARAFAENPSGWLVFSGPSGCGKTYLAAAIHNFRRDVGLPTRFEIATDLFDYLRAAFSPTSVISLSRRFEDVRSAPLLILDDLGAQTSTPWVREKLYQLLNYRYNHELPTVITTLMYHDDMDPRLLSRIEDHRLCTVCPIMAPSYFGVIRETEKSSPQRKTSRR